jgi:hypothetical protein
VPDPAEDEKTFDIRLDAATAARRMSDTTIALARA